MIQVASGESKTSEDDAARESELYEQGRCGLRLSGVNFHDVLIPEYVLRADAFSGELASGTPDP